MTRKLIGLTGSIAILSAIACHHTDQKESTVASVKKNDPNLYFDSSVYYQNHLQVPVLEMSRRHSSPTSPKSYFFWDKETKLHHFIAPCGKAFRVDLPGGTNVWLNSKTDLKFNQQQDSFLLLGEGHFRLAGKPASVQLTGNILVNVKQHSRLNIKAYSKNNLHITLLSGSAEVRDAGKSYRLEQKMNEYFITDGIRGTTNQKDTAARAEWMNPYYHYGGLSLSEILTDLANWYCFDVSIDGINDERMMGGWDRRESLENMIKVLRFSFYTDSIRVEGGKIIATSK